jgi:hypothetical protein
MALSKKIFATCDCETDRFSLENGTDIEPFIWGVYNGKDYHKFYDTQQFVDFVRTKPWNIYAHNGGKFDYLFLLDYLEVEYDDDGEEVSQNVKIINGRISFFKIGRATFFDSYNILPVPLSALEKDDFDYSMLDKDVREENKIAIEKYLRNDCVYLYTYVKQFMERFTTKITLASTAAGEFERLVAKMPESTEEYHDEFSHYYYGGRVTPFKMGVIESKDAKIKVYDINSAYPTAMMKKHPYGTQSGKDYIDMGEHLPKKKEHIEACFITLECETLSVNGMGFGCFPIRENKADGIDFPLGKNTYKVTGWEYLSALKTKAIKDVKIIKVWWFTDCMEFSSYVNAFYAEKKAADKIIKACKKAGDVESQTYKDAMTKRVFAKLFLNSQYGKFCQDSRKFKQYKLVSAGLADDYLRYNAINGYVCYPKLKSNGKPHPLHDMSQDQTPELQAKWSQTNTYANGISLIETPLDKEHTFYNVATGASITGWVRAFMWESLCLVDTPLYCDTDSIACFNGDKLPLGTELGEWDLELENVYKMAIAGKKLYSAFSHDKDSKGEKITKVACKGVRINAREIEKVARGEEILYRKESPIFSISSPRKMLERYVNRQDKKDENVKKRLALTE